MESGKRHLRNKAEKQKHTVRRTYMGSRESGRSRELTQDNKTYDYSK